MTRGMVRAACAIDEAGLTRRKAAIQVNLDLKHLNGMLRGKPPGRDTIERMRVFVEDTNLWFEEASDEERSAWKRSMDSVEERGRDAMPGRATA